MKKISNRLYRGLAFFLAALITLSSVNVSAFAAPTTNSPTQIENSGLSTELENQVIEAYKALNKAYKSKNPADFAEACKLIANLSPTQCVRLFVLKYQDYYKQNYLKDDFAFFDVEKYLIAHPELIDQTHSVNYNKEKALEHYLKYGIYKGDSSYTEFDPVVAIIVQPAATVQAIVNNTVGLGQGLNEIKLAYTVAEGTPVTTQYDLLSSFRDEYAVNGGFGADAGILFISKKTDTPVTILPVQEASEEIEVYSDVPSVEYKDIDIAPAPVEDTKVSDKKVTEEKAPSYEAPVEYDPFMDGGYGGADDYTDPINYKATYGTKGYSLYLAPSVVAEGFGNEDFEMDEDGIPISKVINGDKYNITYYADNYYKLVNDGKEYSSETIAKTKDNAKYTVMVYLCGSDLESGGGVATDDIVNMLRNTYDTSKVNVLVCTGGSKDWKDTFLKENNDVQCSIYLLNPNADKIDRTMEVKTGDAAVRKNYVNSDSLIKLTQISSTIEMAQEELLLGFMDMAYDLFPAENYWLSLWNHGGGAKSGICFGDTIEGSKETTASGLSLAKIETALCNSKLFTKGNNKLGMLTMDACMMGGIEEVYNFSRYADYLVASPEMTQGDVRYDQAIKYINDATVINNKELARVTAKSYIDARSRESESYALTNSAYDLAGAEKLQQNMMELGEFLNTLITYAPTSDEGYRMIRKAAVRAKSYGGSDTILTPGYIDMYDYLTNIDAYLSDMKANTSSAMLKKNYDRAQGIIDSILNTKFIVLSGVVYDADTSLVGDHAGGELLSLRDVAEARKNDSTFRYNKDYENYISGMSIFYPLFDTGYLFHVTDGEATGMSEGFKNYTDESVLHFYSELLKEVSKKANSTEEYARLERVATGLADSKGQDNGMISKLSVDSYAAPNKDNEDRKNNVLRIEFNKDYSGTQYANDSDHKDPLSDFVDVVKELKVAVTTNTKSLGNATKDYDVIIGEGKAYASNNVSSNVEYKDGKLEDTPSITYDLSIQHIFGYLVEGIKGILNPDGKYYVEDTDKNKYQDWAYKMGTAENINLVGVAEKYNNLKNVFVFDGKYYYDASSEDASIVGTNGLLAFSYDAENVKYDYVGAYDKETGELVDKVGAISFNHYTIRDGQIRDLEEVMQEDAVAENLSDGVGIYSQTPVYIIKGETTPVIHSYYLDGSDYLSDNTKLVLEIDTYVPGEEVYETKTVVYEGNEPLYFGNDASEEKYHNNNAIGVLADSGLPEADKPDDDTPVKAYIDDSDAAIENEAVIDEALEEAQIEETEEALKEALEEAIEETVEEAIEEAANEAVEETVEENVVEAVEEAAYEAVEENVVEAIEEAANEAVEETIEEAVDAADVPTDGADLGAKGAALDATEIIIPGEEDYLVEEEEEDEDIPSEEPVLGSDD